MEKTLIKNALAIVTCDNKDHVYWNHDMLIEDRAIRAIAPSISCSDAKIIDASGKFIYPGLINTHHHFFQTFVRNLKTIDSPNLEVIDWLDRIYRLFQLVDSDVIYYSSLTAMADLIKHGCTTAFDQQYCYTPFTGKNAIDRQMDAAKLIGMRFHGGRGTNTLPRKEGSTIPDNMLETTDEFISDTRRLINSYHDTSRYSMNQIVIAPCQPVNCYLDTFIKSVELAKDTGVRMHTHLGEGENFIMEKRWNKRTLNWCKDIGFIGPNTWFAHCWELTDEEYKMIGDLGSGISHCSSPTVQGGFPILPMQKLNDYGVCVSLGCDGSSVNDGSNMLDTIRIAYLMQAYNSRKRGGCVNAYDILKMATINGAKTLGRNDIGSLETGKAADLFIIDGASLELVGTRHDPSTLIGRVGVTDKVWLTMINGKVVYQDNKLYNIDEKSLARKAEEVCDRVFRKTCKEYQNLC